MGGAKMHLYKQKTSGNWWVEFVHDGKRHRQSTGTADKKKAKRFIESIQLASRAPTFESAVEILRLFYGETRKAGLPLSSAWDTYAQVAKAVGRDQVEEKTWRMRRERLARFIAWMGDKRATLHSVEDVDGVTAAAYAEKLIADGLKSKTRQNIIGDLSSVWRMLSKSSSGLGNPWAGLSPRDTDSVRLDEFTPDEEERILAAAKRVGKGWHLACLIARWTGLRYGDIATLKWSSVSLAESVIRVTPNKTKKHGIVTTIPIEGELVGELNDARARAREAPDGTMASEFVLPNHAALYGKRGKSVQRMLNFAEVLKEAKVEGNHTFHSWRHTFRTRLAQTGASTETAMRLCGHTDTRTSLHYDHATHLDELRAAIKKAVASPEQPSKTTAQG